MTYRAIIKSKRYCLSRTPHVLFSLLVVLQVVPLVQGGFLVPNNPLVPNAGRGRHHHAADHPPLKAFVNHNRALLQSRAQSRIHLQAIISESEFSDSGENTATTGGIDTGKAFDENDTTLRSSATTKNNSNNSNKKKSSIAAVASKRDSTVMADNPNLKKTTASNRWESFDYLQHWYPVVWACDVPPHRPLKVTLFDVNYVIAKNSHTGEWTALEDKCPHKAAALSEGRLTSSGYFQCAYHGWSFNGTTGDCVQIPQSPPKATAFPPRSCAKAIPIREHQTMVWLWPGPIPDGHNFPDPPTVPEMDLPGWQVIRVVRDFDMVDWSLLASNIMDPDHGCFAHTALAFDWYSANAQHPLSITHESFDNAGWILSSQVPAVDKLLAVDLEKRQSLGMKIKKKPPLPEDIRATSTFIAPTTVALSRRDAQNETKFITAFWVSPVGTGKSRFLSAAIANVGNLPIKIPRWVFQINLNRFLDQDTLLVASQQPPILTAEAQGVEKPRASLFAYGSPTDKTVRLIDQFWDATLHKAPNRKSTLQHLYRSGQLQQIPPREIVLDRKVQHLDICPDSQGFVRNCRVIRQTSLAAAALWVGKALWDRALPRRFRLFPLWALGLAWITDQLRKQYYFVKTKASRDKDLKQIPVKAWLDP